MNPVDECTSPTRISAAPSSNSWSMPPDDSFSFASHSRVNNNNNPYAPQPQVNFKPPWISRMNSFLPNPTTPSNNPTSPFHPQQQQQQQQQSPTMLNPYQGQNTWLLSEMSAMLRQNQQQQQPMVTFNSNITLSTTAQQILANNNNNNNRPLRSEKIDIEVIKHLIREAKWKRQCGMKKEVCLFYAFSCWSKGEERAFRCASSVETTAKMN